MIIKFIKRMCCEVDLRLLAKFAYNFGWKGMRAIQKFEKRKKQNNGFPAFTVLSITNNCNLKCQGCWVTQKPIKELSIDEFDDVINESKKYGSYFFGILGGEPFLYKGLFDVIEKHPDCYFQIFTNGLLITDKIAKKMRKLGNITPLISIEGDKEISDIRRGGHDVYSRTLQGLEHCRNNKLIIGTATSVCKSNIQTAITEDYLKNLINLGVHYTWYYIYRPVGPIPTPELALDENDILNLREFMVNIRTKLPIGIIDAYWDNNGNALCPAAVGISHHINPNGDIEFCPPIQFAKDNIKDNSLSKCYENSEFLEKFRHFTSNHTQGCILLEDPNILKDFLLTEKAQDTTGRNTGYKELENMKPCIGHHLPGKEIPEKSWIYRFAKKHWFFGFGAYG